MLGLLTPPGSGPFCLRKPTFFWMYSTPVQKRRVCKRIPRRSIYICIYTLYTYAYPYIYVSHMHMYIHIIHICISIYTHMYMYIHIIHICIWIYTHMHMYIHFSCISKWHLASSETPAAASRLFTIECVLFCRMCSLTLYPSGILLPQKH